MTAAVGRSANSGTLNHLIAPETPTARASTTVPVAPYVRTPLSPFTARLLLILHVGHRRVALRRSREGCGDLQGHLFSTDQTRNPDLRGARL